MPLANRYFLPGHVWRITHRCHKKEFLLKFSYDSCSLQLAYIANSASIVLGLTTR